MLNYNSAKALLKNRASKKLENNTYLIYNPQYDEYYIKLYDTNVVTIKSNNNYILDSGGWKTATTKNRINKYSSAYISQNQYKWYMKDGSIFYDKIIIDSSGIPLEPHFENLDRGISKELEKKLNKMIKEYIEGFIEDIKINGLKLPSGGDCWSCYFNLQNENPNQECLGYDHYLSHFEEKYYVPSLLYRAVQESHRNLEFIYQFKEIGLIELALTKFFNKRKAEILKEMIKAEEITKSKDE